MQVGGTRMSMGQQLSRIDFEMKICIYIYICICIYIYVCIYIYICTPPRTYQNEAKDAKSVFFQPSPLPIFHFLLSQNWKGTTSRSWSISPMACHKLQFLCQYVHGALRIFLASIAVPGFRVTFLSSDRRWPQNVAWHCLPWCNGVSAMQFLPFTVTLFFLWTTLQWMTWSSLSS